MALDIKKWKSIETVTSPHSLLNEEYELKGYDTSFRITKRDISFSTENEKKIEMIIHKVLYSTPYEAGRRDIRFNETLKQTIIIPKEDYNFIMKNFNMNPDFANPKTYHYHWYSPYFVPPIQHKIIRGSDHTYKNTYPKGETEMLIKIIEKKNPYKVEWFHNWRGMGTYRNHPSERRTNLLAEEIKDGKKHIIKREINEEILTNDRKQNHIKVVTNRNLDRPGDFLFIMEYEPEKYTFQWCGMFDMFGKIFPPGKNLVENLTKYAFINEDKLVRIYDGASTMVSMQNSENWKKKFDGKSRKTVVNSLDKLFKAEYYDRYGICSLIPHTIDTFCSGGLEPSKISLDEVSKILLQA